MRRFDIPGMSIAFGRGKTLLFSRGYGWADMSRKIPVTEQSLFRIASNSKALTSAAIFKLIEAGRLTLETPVFAPNGVLSEYSMLGAHRDWMHAITVHHLLTHTAGGWSNEQDDPMFDKRGLDRQALIKETLRTRALERAPGEHYAYSNFGYCVLGRVIERVSGEPYVWTSQDLVDTSPTASGGLELFRTHPAQMTMATGWIVERLNVVGDFSHGKLAVLVDPLLDAFLLETAEEGLCNRIVPTVGTTTHARSQTIGSAEALPIIASVLRALV